MGRCESCSHRLRFSSKAPAGTSRTTPRNPRPTPARPVAARAIAQRSLTRASRARSPTRANRPRSRTPARRHRRRKARRLSRTRRRKLSVLKLVSRRPFWMASCLRVSVLRLVPCAPFPPSRRRVRLPERFNLSEVDLLQVLAELIAEVRPPEREVHDRLQEPELIARVVA